MATTPAWGPKDKHKLLNTKIPRVDGPFKTTGAAVYTHDVRVPGMLFARILRSPYAHATVNSIDLEPAKKIPGVVAVIPGSTDIRYEGTPVAAVAATTSEIADDAIHAIVVKYDVLPHVVTPEQALAPGAQAVFPNDAGARGNARAGARAGNPDTVDAALASCDAVVEVEYRTPVIHHTCLETHGAAVDYSGGDSAVVYSSIQGTFAIPRDAAQAMGLTQSNVAGVVQYMGGGFGSKFQIGIEGMLACRLAKLAGVPVKLVLTRKDEFVMAGNGGGAIQKFKAGANKDGKAVAIHSTQYRFSGIGTGSLAGQPYVYDFTNKYNQATTVHSNVDSARSLRAPGNPPACFAMESLMDELAYKIGMDPVEFRKKNLTNDPAHVRQLELGAKEIGWERRNPVPGAWPGTLKRGFGCGVGQWGGGGAPGNDVTVRVGQDGSVLISVGTQDLGTGTRTIVRAVVAEELGLGMGDVAEKIGDTRLPNASTSGGSATAASLSPVLKTAAFKARAAVAAAVAPLLGAQADDIVFDNKTVSGNGKSLSWTQACAALPSGGVSTQGEFQRDLSSNRTHGACFAEVEVDTETGHVRVVRMVSVQDCGLPLNRLAVESQINGGMIQGIGMALLEGQVIDPRLGFMLNSSFMDYKIPGCLEMPELVPIIDDGDERNAVVGVGEPPSIPPGAAIANAVHNACGVRVRDLPITPDKILMGLMAKA
ncbi:MAG: xanthine dehydrogenase family protein molybdopterin-binding subunit [Tepidisphaeraceae bacterium]